MVCLFYCFFRLPIYESIAAIFWQSASYVFISSSWFLLRSYGVTATFCSFVHAISTEVRVWRHFSLLVERVFCSFAWLIFWSHLTYSLSKMTSSFWNWLLFTLIQRDKVKWVCVTLNEGYLRSANRDSNNLYRFLIKIWQISLQWKDDFFGPSFYCFFRLPIYESIAAIFWQSASYVFISSSWFLLRPYDVTATFCSFVHAISTELHVWRHFSILVERVFLFMRVIKFLVTLDLPHSQKWLPHFEIDFYLL